MKKLPRGMLMMCPILRTTLKVRSSKSAVSVRSDKRCLTDQTSQLCTRAADYVDTILRGTTGDIPALGRGSKACKGTEHLINTQPRCNALESYLRSTKTS